MVDKINGKAQQQQIINLKGKKQKIDTSKLEGLKKTEQNKKVFEMFDSDNNGTLNKTEADNMQSWLKETASNNKLSARESKKAAKNKTTFDSISILAQQQNALEEGKEYIEKNGNVTTHVIKTDKGTEKYDSTTDEKGTETRAYDDGTKVIIHKDKTLEKVDKDGGVTKFDKEGTKILYTKDGKTTTFDSDGGQKTVDKEGKLISKTEIKDNKEVKTDYEYKDNKTIARETIDGKSGSVTVSEYKDGHTVDTKYETEENYKKNRPSEQIIDAQNTAKKKTVKYTYDEKDNVKIETTDALGNVVTEFKDKDGKKIDNPNEQPKENNEKDELETITVEEGNSITDLVKKGLKSQGIENPTSEQLKQARKEFLELNKDLVKTYNGAKKQWHGNKFFYVGDVVKIPKFNKTQTSEKVEDTQKQEEKPVLNPKQKEAIEKMLKEMQDQQLQEKLKEVQKILGDRWIAELDENNEIIVKDKNGNILKEVTTVANDKNTDEDDVNDMLRWDNNKNKALELNEFKTFIIKNMELAGPEIQDKNRAKVEKIIEKYFNNIDSTKKDGSLTKEELLKNAPKFVTELLEEIDKFEASSD